MIYWHNGFRDPRSRLNQPHSVSQKIGSRSGKDIEFQVINSGERISQAFEASWQVLPSFFAAR